MPCNCAEGWICEAHPTLPARHDACHGLATACLDPECPWWRGPRPAALDTSDWTHVAHAEPRTRPDY